jgi:hypothetical protein
LIFCFASHVFASDPSAAERGRKALLGRAFYPAAWSATAYHGVNRWQHPSSTPADCDRAFRERYGLHVPPYPNGPYPMGLREASGLLSKGMCTDCMLCHGGSIAGQSYVGLGNSTLDVQSLFQDLNAADGLGSRLPFTFCRVRGTSEAGAMSVFLLGWREADLRMRTTPIDLDLHDDLCEDVPAWWLLKKKKTMYYTGSGDTRSVRTLMQFMLSPLTPASSFAREEATFRDIQAYLKQIQPPPYPFPIDRKLAQQGEKIFVENCSRCHGTYGENWTYPNKIVALDVIGTDPKRCFGISEKFYESYNRSWFAHEKPGWIADEYPAHRSLGYQAPPLDGIWATAPYFHNGSVPTVYHLLNSRTRPTRYTRSFRTDADAYDTDRLGWKVELVDQPADPSLSPIERRKIYDTTQPGRGNGGHTFGDSLEEAERLAVIEYLKTL